MMQSSFEHQVERLLSAGFPVSVVNAVAETLLQKVQGSKPRTKAQLTNDQRPEVVPYLHKASHNLKKVATRYGVPVVFSAPSKLGQLCSRIATTGKKRACEKRHEKPFVDCAVGVVYEIPLTCGKSYIGQTGRCLNNRLREHAQNLKSNNGAHLTAHCDSCTKCEPRFSETKILGKSRYQKARELLETHRIRLKGSDCVSDTSVVLFKAEGRFLDKFLR